MKRLRLLFVFFVAVIGCNPDVEAPVIECLVDGDCSDGDHCNGIEACFSGACIQGDAIDPSDGLDCTDDFCDPENGIIRHTPVDMSDGNLCTDDVCIESVGIVHSISAAGSLCSLPDSNGGFTPGRCDMFGACCITCLESPGVCVDNVPPVCGSNGETCVPCANVAPVDAGISDCGLTPAPPLPDCGLP